MIALALTLALTVPVQDPVGPVPNELQTAWFHRAKHLVVRVGLEDLLATTPEEWNPSQFDATAWVELARAAEFSALVLEVRDGAGFCLWPSEHTEFDQASSGHPHDLGQQLAEACAAAGMPFGVEFASLDATTIGAQVDELCARYADLAWIGFPDDAQGVDWPALIERVRAGAPAAMVVAPVGGDVRRVPSGEVVRDAQGAYRLPLATAELPRRSQDLEQLVLDTLGVGANLGLVVRAEPDGSIGEDTAALLHDFRDDVATIFSGDLLAGTEPRASHSQDGHAPDLATDGDVETYWAASAGVSRCFFHCVDLPRSVIDTVVLAEPLARGASITGYRLQGLRDNLWVDLHNGNGIGPRRILRIDPSDYQSLRLIVLDAKAPPALASFEAYAAPPRVQIEASEQVFIGATKVRFFTSHPSAVVRYTLDGSEPTSESTLYQRPLDIDHSCTVTARAFTGDLPGQYSARLRLRAYTWETLRAPEATEPAAAGLRARVWAGPWLDLDDVSWEREPVVDRTVDSIGPGADAGSDGTVYRFEGYVRAHKDGIYGFFVRGYNHVRIYVGDDLVLESYTGADRLGEIGLLEGWHPLRIDLVRTRAFRSNTIQWRGPSLSKRPFLAQELGRDAQE